MSDDTLAKSPPLLSPPLLLLSSTIFELKIFDDDSKGEEGIELLVIPVEELITLLLNTTLNAALVLLERVALFDFDSSEAFDRLF
jgi:hypothetical protein